MMELCSLGVAKTCTRKFPLKYRRSLRWAFAFVAMPLAMPLAMSLATVAASPCCS